VFWCGVCGFGLVVMCFWLVVVVYCFLVGGVFLFFFSFVDGLLCLYWFGLVVFCGWGVWDLVVLVVYFWCVTGWALAFSFFAVCLVLLVVCLCCAGFVCFSFLCECRGASCCGLCGFVLVGVFFGFYVFFCFS